MRLNAVTISGFDRSVGMFAGTVVHDWYRSFVDFLPKGQSLPEPTWRARHRGLTRLLWAHVVGAFIFGLVRNYSVSHAALDAGIICIFAIGASVTATNRRFSSGVAALGLVTASAVIVHLSGGKIEAHFHFFVMVGILTLYQDWMPFLMAIGFVVFHHTAIGIADAGSVYDHPAAVQRPLIWALIHGAFLMAASAASILAWKLNEEQALKDALTGLANRRLFEDRVVHALTRAQRRAGAMAVLFIDLDDFKDVNDTLGHAGGDQLLRVVADRLRTSVRPADTVARLGGDEFAVLLEDITGQEEVEHIVERLEVALGGELVIRGKHLNVAASIGVAFNTVGETAESFLRDADVAMYVAKSRGKAGHAIFEDEMHAALLERIELEHSISRATSAGQLRLHYQPLVSMETGAVTGFEALVRWQHPTRGLLPPDAFIAVAESTGAIVELGRWALDEACHQAQEWSLAHPASTFSMAVNLSPNQLFGRDAAREVQRTLRRSGFPANRLVLELTEGVMVKDTAVTAERLSELKSLGVLLAIDDFGTGYSSLSYLRQLPFDILKIDKLFVDGISAGHTEAAFAKAIIRLAQTLELETVAEGVECEAQAVALAELGCATAQGYYFSPPLAPADAVKLLDVHRLTPISIGHA